MTQTRWGAPTCINRAPKVHHCTHLTKHHPCAFPTSNCLPDAPLSLILLDTRPSPNSLLLLIFDLSTRILAAWPLTTCRPRPIQLLALNGNHEMYSGGESFFKVVLPAFDQPQPFFCLEGEHWRIIGLDTAYLGGRLKPQTADDACMQAQWDWLVNLLKTGPKLANILLTHLQPVSAHSKEFSDSVPLGDDIHELLMIWPDLKDDMTNEMQSALTVAKRQYNDICVSAIQLNHLPRWSSVEDGLQQR